MFHRKKNLAYKDCCARSNFNVKEVLQALVSRMSARIIAPIEMDVVRTPSAGARIEDPGVLAVRFVLGFILPVGFFPVRSSMHWLCRTRSSWKLQMRQQRLLSRRLLQQARCMRSNRLRCLWMRTMTTFDLALLTAAADSVVLLKISRTGREGPASGDHCLEQAAPRRSRTLMHAGHPSDAPLYWRRR